MKDTVILYHGNCLDGFSAAYAAWKKFGDSATYIAVFHGDEPPSGLEGKEIYIIDFSYTEDRLRALEEKAKRLVVLDHHAGAHEAVAVLKEHVFDNDRSGAGIAWGYFHPGVPLPRLLSYIQDGDLWRNSLPHHSEVGAYLSTLAFDFATFEQAKNEAEDDALFEKLIQKGAAFAEYRDYVCQKLIEQAELVQFEGFEIFAANAPRLFRSQVGHILATQQGPLSIVWYPNHGTWHFSMRGDGSIDLSEIAKKYGGNGHRNAASFRLPFGADFPFTPTKSV